MDDRGLAPATRAAYGRVASSYLVFLESLGVYCLDSADGASVLRFLESLSGKWAKSSLFWVVSNFRPFLKFTGRADLVDAVNLAGVKRTHAILPVLSDEDEQRVVQACASVAVGARDAAITLLALTTGRPASLRHHRPAAEQHRLARSHDRDCAAEDEQPAQGAADHVGDGQARRLRSSRPACLG